jgi:hypothetical protein
MSDPPSAPPIGVPEQQARTARGPLRDTAGRGWWQRFEDIVPDWFGSFVTLEQTARLIRCYEPQFVPGLLQTEDYARAVLTGGTVGRRSPGDIERHVEFRMARQSLLTGPGAPVFQAVLDETVLRRPVGSSDVMRAQIDRLVEAADLPNVTLQIAPLAAGHHAGTYSPFTLFRPTAPGTPDVACVEYLTGALYFERPEEVAEYAHTMDRMTAHADSPRRSRALLRRLRRDL